jgi:oligopeptide transport system ATP-binding protein
MSSLNPRKKIGDIVGTGLDVRRDYTDKADREKKIGDMLERVGLSREQAGRSPGQFSGGQRQRAGIARALIVHPKLIIADECIAALDASVQAQVVNLLRRIRQETGTAFLFISHDLSMVRYLSDRIGVLHLGYLLETGSTEEIFRNPVHPYTRNLLAAVPRPNPVIQFRPEARYDYETSGLLYENGNWHTIEGEGTHRVWCTDQEFKKWGFGDEG